MEFDPYQILEVSRNATLEEIRHSYRALARRYHPDLHHDPNPQIEEKFKLVSQAYAVLSDTRRRQLYDLYGPASLSPGFHGPGSQSQPDVEPAAENFSPRRRHKTQVNIENDVHAPLEIDLGLAIRGGQTQIFSPIDGQSLMVNVLPGAVTGAQIRLKGMGQPGKRHEADGDLVLQIVVKSNPYYRREGLDLYLDLPITIVEAWQGATITVEGIDENLSVRIPPDCRGGELLRLADKGLLGPQGQRGQMFIHLCLRLPERFAEVPMRLEQLSRLYRSSIRDGLHL